MRVRKHIQVAKIILSDTNWQTDDIPPRHTCIYPKTRPNRAGWEWRSALVKSDISEYIFLSHVHPDRDNWQAMLVLKSDLGGSLISRYEYHGSHPGIHVHADCSRGGIEVGPTGINDLLRIPQVGKERQNNITLRKNLFWDKARLHFRIDYPKGELL